MQHQSVSYTRRSRSGARGHESTTKRATPDHPLANLEPMRETSDVFGSAMSPDMALALQATVGNHALQRMLARHGLEMIGRQRVPFDAPLSHAVTRLVQAIGYKGKIRSTALSSIVLPVPAGIMLGVFRKAAR